MILCSVHQGHQQASKRGALKDQGWHCQLHSRIVKGPHTHHPRSSPAQARPLCLHRKAVDTQNSTFTILQPSSIYFTSP